MSDLPTKCSVCQAYIDEEDLFCANCGAEAPHAASVVATPPTLVKLTFECQGCAASTTYDADAQTLRCPFCGSDGVKTKTTKRTLAAKFITPFAVDQDQASTILKRWMGNGFFRPNDLVQTASVEKMTAVYVPYWVFRASTNTYWTGDSSATPPGARGDWYPLFGSTNSTYAGLLIGASKALTPSETRALCPFDMAAQVPAEGFDVGAVLSEQFRVPRKYARPLARQGLENMEREKCAHLIPARSRNVKVNVRLEGLRSEPVLLPIWIIAFRYRRQELYRFVINGQTGKSTGKAPFSYAKLFLVLAATLAVILGIGGLVGLVGLLSGG
jgi:Zn finger protein HypA/HybF involved in hydrogenase expression